MKCGSSLNELENISIHLSSLPVLHDSVMNLSNLMNNGYDLVWEKSSPVGFLSAKQMPMRKHGMIYVFYEDLPLYDISSHNHKFINTRPPQGTSVYGDLGIKTDHIKYDPPLPSSVIKMHKPCTAGTDHPYGNTNGGEKGCYDPPLPTSVIQFKTKEENIKH